MYKRLIKPILFLFQPEKAHHIAFFMLGILGKIPGMLPLIRSISGKNKPEEGVEIAGLFFPNRVGLAAGFDKDALRYKELGAMGFGFVEIGTVTPEPQVGNPQPRLFRLPADQAIINRMGFNNSGMHAIADRLKSRDKKLIIGGNIGKNKSTPNENAVDDYKKCFTSLFSLVDYFVVNVSSPNTAGLRQLQDKEPLRDLLLQLQSLNQQLSKQYATKTKPVFLKIAPDLTNEQLNDVVEVIIETKCAGVIATNTTISRNHLKTNDTTIEKIGQGGLSGAPVRERSTEVIRYLSQKPNGAFAIIGVGGIHSAEDAIEKLNAGASLIQIYTGFIYKGPTLIREIRNAFVSK